jgi:hypothetical protein
VRVFLRGFIIPLGCPSLFRAILREYPQVIVSLIVNSFERLDELPKKIEGLSSLDLYGYSFKADKWDRIVVLSSLLLVIAVSTLERGYWI